MRSLLLVAAALMCAQVSAKALRGGAVEREHNASSDHHMSAATGASAAEVLARASTASTRACTRFQVPFRPAQTLRLSRRPAIRARHPSRDSLIRESWAGKVRPRRRTPGGNP